MSEGGRAKAIALGYRSLILPNSFGNQDPKREGRVSLGLDWLVPSPVG